MQRDSIEYLKFNLVERDAKDISGDVVQVALLASPTDTPTWLDCTFVANGTDPKTGKACTIWRTTSAITWSVANYPAAKYDAVAKLTDSPETPRAKVGSVTF